MLLWMCLLSLHGNETLQTLTKKLLAEVSYQDANQCVSFVLWIFSEPLSKNNTETTKVLKGAKPVMEIRNFCDFYCN